MYSFYSSIAREKRKYFLFLPKEDYVENFFRRRKKT